MLYAECHAEYTALMINMKRGFLVAPFFLAKRAGVGWIHCCPRGGRLNCRDSFFLFTARETSFPGNRALCLPGFCSVPCTSGLSSLLEASVWHVVMGGCVWTAAVS